MCNLLVEALIARKKHDEASVWLNKSIRFARKAGLVPDLATAISLQGRLEGISGNLEGSYAKSREALALVKQLAANCSTDQERASFLKRRSVLTLIDEVRRLAAIIGQKQRAE